MDRNKLIERYIFPLDRKEFLMSRFLSLYGLTLRLFRITSDRNVSYVIYVIQGSRK